MRTIIVERWSTHHPEKKDKFEYHENILWQGETNCVYLDPNNTNIKQPSRISIEAEKVEITYGEPPSNIKVREDKQPNIGQVYLWIEPAIDAEGLEKLKTQQEGKKDIREANLKVLKP